MLLTAWLLIQTKPVQNWLVYKATDRLSRDLGTKVEIKHVDFSLFNKMLLKGVLVEDRQKDTLLYAGTLKINITDWFFIKDKAVLKYVGLEDAVIKMQRSDSVWNYQFVADYFSGPSSGKKKKGIEWDLKKAEFKNIHFKKLDKWRGEDMVADIGSFYLDADKMDFNKKDLSITEISLINPLFAITNYDGNRPPKKKIISNNEEIKQQVDSLLKWNAAGWNIHVNQLQIKEGIFRSNRVTERKAFDYFDGKHISFEKINASFKNLHWIKDTISADANISTKERSGFEVKQLSAKMKFHPQAMEFDSLNILTNKSHIKKFFALRYNHFNDDMADFVNNVTMDGHFDNSAINSDDIAFFAPAVKDWKKEITLSGNIKGTVNFIGGKNVIAQAGKHTYLNGDFKLAGLPNINETFIDFKANDFKTTYGDAITFVPALRKVSQPRIDKIGNLRFKGSFTGFIHDFVTFGTIQTNLGTVVSDLNMKLPKGKSPAYSGSIKTDNFRLGEFLGTTDVGTISGEAKIKGSGFTSDKIFAEVNGHLKQVQLKNYNYQDITLSGNIDKNKYDGVLNINDPNLKGKISGVIINDKLNPSFDFDAGVDKASLQQLGITKQDLRFSGNINTNFTGKTVDDFLGSAHIFNATLFNGEERLSFDSLTIYSSVEDGIKQLSVRSNEASVSLNGKFTVADLPASFQVFLNKYYPSYINIPKWVPQNQDFSFSIKTGNVEQFLNLFDKNIKGLNDADINGRLNTAQNQMDVNVTAPSFTYKNLAFTDISLTGKGTLDKLNLNGTVGDVMVNDSLRFPNSEIAVESANDVSNVSIKTSATKAVNAAELSAIVETRKDGFKINFNPSSLVFNDKKWVIEKNGELVLSKTRLDASEVKLSSGEQEIIISTEPSSIGSSNDVVVTLKKVTLEDFTPFFLKQPKIEGRVTGEVRISDPFKNLNIEGQPIIENARLENDSLGVLKTDITFNKKSGDIVFKVISENEGHRFDVDGIFHTKDSLRNNLGIAIKLDNSEIHFLERYIGTLFGNIKGRATGEIKMVGPSSSPDLLGDVVIRNGGFKILYTQCPYTFDEAKISFQKGAIDFGTIILQDTLGKNHKARFSGVLYHSFFKDMAFQMNFSSDGILLLNTTSKDNKLFNGKAIGKVSNAYLRGPETDMRMGFTAEPTDSSHIIITSSTSRESGNVDFIVWRQYGKEMKETFTRQGTNLTLDMRLKANPLAKVDVVLDEITGDVVKGQGNGNLNIKVGTKEPLSMTGNYEVEKGEYLFNFQTFWKYGFDITGGNITWNGDPYNAKINIKARYIAKDVNLNSLTSLSGNTINEKSNLYINAGLTNTLKNPIIEFSLELPEGSQYKNDPVVTNKLKNYEGDKNEMNKQVASLLLFNTFISGEQSFVSGSRTSSFLAGTAGQVIFNFVANTLKSLLKKLLKDPNIDPYITLSNSQLNIQNNSLQDIQAAAKAGINYRILNGRIILKVGGDVNYSSNSSLFKTNRTNSNFLFNQDLSMEYLINNEGKLRLIVFNRGNFDFDRGKYARKGLGISYTRDFDLFSELFVSEKKRKSKDVQQP